MKWMFIFLAFMIVGCNQETNPEAGTVERIPLSEAILENKYLLDKCDFVAFPDTFYMSILEFKPSAQCGLIASASYRVGEANNNIVRVLTLCETDTNYRIGEKIKVVVSDVPEIGFSVFFEPNSNYHKRLKTTFGALYHIAQ